MIHSYGEKISSSFDLLSVLFIWGRSNVADKMIKSTEQIWMDLEPAAGSTKQGLHCFWVLGVRIRDFQQQSRIPCKKEAIELVLSEGTTIFSLPPRYFSICLPRLKRCSLAILWYCFSFEAGCTSLRKKGFTLSIWRMCWFHLHQVRAKDEAC